MKKIFFTIVIVLVTNFASFAQNVVLETQAQVDAFVTSQIVINGDLNIGKPFFYNSNITSLDNLVGITTVTGMVNIYNNKNLSTLRGLRGLTSIGTLPSRGTVSIIKNARLESFSGGLSNISTIDNIWITDNDALTFSTGGFNSLTTAHNLSISENDELIDLDGGFPMLSRLKGFLTFKKNMRLTTLVGLEGLTSMGGSLSIRSNPSLTTLRGLGDLETIGGFIWIGVDAINSPKPNVRLINFCAISDVRFLDRDDNIIVLSPTATTEETNSYQAEIERRYLLANNRHNPTYAELSVNTTCLIGSTREELTLNSQEEIDILEDYITSVTGNVIIDGTTDGDITDLTNLSAITSIGGNLQITNNMGLVTLNGLNNLTALDGNLLIGTTGGTDESPNATLTNLCAISQLVTGDALAQIEGEYNIVNNGYNPTYSGLGSGIAETAADQNDGCSEFVFVPPTLSTDTFSKEGFSLFPNPVTDVLYVKSDSEITSITISNVSGQEVLKSKSSKINVSDLSKGIYFARVVSGEKVAVKKLVKN